MALNLDDLKDQMGTQFRHSWEQFQESSLYNQLKDRYENLTPLAQKLSIVGIVLLFTLIVFSIPWGFYSQSSQYISEFEGKRNIIRDLLKVSREAHDNPDIPVPPPLESVKNQIDTTLKAAQLIPEQMKGIEIVTEKSDIVPATLSKGILRVSLAKLNLRQIVDLGYAMQAINSSLKMKDLSIEANLQNPKYFDVVFKLIALNVPQEPLPAPPEVEEPKNKGARKKPVKKEEE